MTPEQRVELRRQIEAERRKEPWPQFGASPDPRMAARDGFNMALDVVLDLLDALDAGPRSEEGHADKVLAQLDYEMGLSEALNPNLIAMWRGTITNLRAALRTTEETSDA